MNVTFSLKLPKECLKYDKEMSCHNHNYYNIDFSVLGICIFPTKCCLENKVQETEICSW